MNIYSVSTGCYSDHNEVMLESDSFLSESQFNELCANILNGLPEEKMGGYFGCEDAVVNELCDKHGFKRLKYINCHLYDYSFCPDDGDFPVSKTIGVEE